MSKQDNNDIVENIKNVIDKYKNLAFNNGNNVSEDLLEIDKESDEVIAKVNTLRKMLLIITTCLAIVMIGSLFAIYKLQVAYDQIFDLKLEQTETRFDSINKVITGLKYIANKKVRDTNTVTYFLRPDGTIITYQNMSDERDSLFKENQKLKYEFSDIKTELELIKNNYPIKCIRKKYKKNNSEGTTYRIESPKIDEALFFYEKYKHRIEELEQKSN